METALHHRFDLARSHEAHGFRRGVVAVRRGDDFESAEVEPPFRGDFHEPLRRCDEDRLDQTQSEGLDGAAKRDVVTRMRSPESAVSHVPPSTLGDPHHDRPHRIGSDRRYHQCLPAGLAVGDDDRLAFGSGIGVSSIVKGLPNARTMAALIIFAMFASPIRARY